MRMNRINGMNDCLYCLISEKEIILKVSLVVARTDQLDLSVELSELLLSEEVSGTVGIFLRCPCLVNSWFEYFVSHEKKVKTAGYEDINIHRLSKDQTKEHIKMQPITCSIKSYKSLKNHVGQIERLKREESLAKAEKDRTHNMLNIGFGMNEDGQDYYLAQKSWGKDGVPWLCDTSKPLGFAQWGWHSAASSPNESNVIQEQYWKRLKEKPKSLSEQRCWSKSNQTFQHLDPLPMMPDMEDPDDQFVIDDDGWKKYSQ
ncbi:hypothetical protein BC332_16325 [Capsicum chinense]|nr:hypothetical protein BC332_16325 [Capsicum chinense]